ncbi:ribosome silencing factor [bacterium]|nr:ribosome silencing factor [bacterium]
MDKQAENIQILDLRKLTTLADFFVIATGSVDVHTRAIVDHVERELRKSDDRIRPLSVEGRQHLNWVLMDLGEVVLHVFQREARDYYQLEKLWGDAPTEYVADPDEIPQP